MTEPTPQERHYRDILITVKARLRQMEADSAYSPNARTQAGRIADLIATRIDAKAKE